eukprot:6123768-Amphidinium_carterae.1
MADEFPSFAGQMALNLDDKLRASLSNCQKLLAEVCYRKGYCSVLRILVVGANGAGKSTLLSILGGKRMIPRGYASVLGKDSWHLALLHLLGMVCVQYTTEFETCVQLSHVAFIHAYHGKDAFNDPAVSRDVMYMGGDLSAVFVLEADSSFLLQC